jgi:hypothetical protein
MDYNFTLKDNNQRTFRLFVWFLFFLHVAAAGVIALNADNANVRLGIYILLGFYALISIGYYFLRKDKKAFEPFSWIMALMYANFWLKHVGVIALFIFGLIYLFVHKVQGKKTTVAFSIQGVHLTRLFKTVIISWATTDNVIMKDSLLTIDLSSNKLIQAEVVENITMEEEINFNRFCADQLKNSIQQNGSQS